MTRRCNAKGLTCVEIVVILLVGIFVLSLLPVAYRHARSEAARVVCATNLATLGKAMLVYANDYKGKFPRAGGRNTTWGGISQWDAPNRYRAFGLAADGTGGEATISSCFYLLVKYMGLPPKDFICPGDKGAIEFRLAEQPVHKSFTLTDAWDFGLDSDRHCSYAYHIPFGLLALTTSNDPGLPVAADRSPWLKGPSLDPKPLASFKPDLPPFKGTPEQARAGNSISHGEDGQNVLLLDGHVTFEERSYCGLDDDNIYLISGDMARGSPIGTVPVPPIIVPANKRDSVLVHDPPAHRVVITTYQAEDIDSKSLKQTAVVATLDCPLAEHKNVIWCSTFQLAWDKLRQDLIREPVQLVGAEPLANRLNQGTYPTGDVEAKSYYVATGFVKDGIIEQVQKEMARRFPSEPVPTFDERYRTLPDVILAYAYLKTEVGFDCPYYTFLNSFHFRDSGGAQTPVTAFCTQASGRSGGSEQVREQVEILYYDDDPSLDAEQFAVDLSKQTQPYQVILARIPRCDTFGEAAKTLREKIAAFKNDADYQALRKLRAVDTLIVPDVLFKLTHHFNELLYKHFANEKWQSHFFFEAVQKIDFTLCRVGVILKSEARLGGAASRSPAQLAKPRHLHFDRPFLICVKKREPNATPFFLMWVDNAELLRPYEESEKP